MQEYAKIEILKRELLVEYLDFNNSLYNNLYLNNPILYHYTNLKGLEGILDAKIIQQTQSKYLNDENELRFGQKIILELIQDSNIPHRNILQTILNRFIDEFHLRYKFYISSFSLKRNCHVLWNQYANNGKGYSIGFKDFLLHIKSPTSPANPSVNSILTPVYYGNKKAKNILNNYISIYQTKCSAGIKQNLNSRKLYTQLDAILSSFLFGLTASIKSESYKNENETRLIRVICEKNPILKKIGQYNNEEISHNNHVTLIHTNKTLSVHEFENKDICEILIGPNSDFDKEKFHVERILEKNGFDLKNIHITH